MWCLLSHYFFFKITFLLFSILLSRGHLSCCIFKYDYCWFLLIQNRASLREVKPQSHFKCLGKMWLYQPMGLAGFTRVLVIEWKIISASKESEKIKTRKWMFWGFFFLPNTKLPLKIMKNGHTFGFSDPAGVFFLTVILDHINKLCWVQFTNVTVGSSL